MKTFFTSIGRKLLINAVLLASAPCFILAQPAPVSITVGVSSPVRIVRDTVGINHIYADNEHDLFFAQGYAAAVDRLFQLEVWRRQATGTVAELLGSRELKRDIGARLFSFRGDMTRELAHYHPRSTAIIRAFVDGVNARIAETETAPSLLPIEFRLLGTKPGRWTPSTVISRHQGLLGNIEDELNTSRAVAAVGAEKVKQLVKYSPGDPNLEIDSTINRSLLQAPILELYQAFRAPLRFRPADIVSPGAGNDSISFVLLSRSVDRQYAEARDHEKRDIGSNNWVVSGSRTATGRPLMANDPHRSQSSPSLRYWTHLVAPGWDVIGGGEPEIPGISIGFNRAGAWGLTVFATDGEDLYVYRTNPANHRQYRYGQTWEAMRTIRETIPIKGARDTTVELRYTRHGPVVYEDTVNHVAYAVRAAWLEPGSSPYLASLRMDQAKTWEEFRAACAYAFIPGENMVWADTAGNIGWQAVGIAPIRRNWSGLVAVPGDGRYEWNGYLPIVEKPHSLNPPEGFIATANNDVIPPGYAHMDAVGFSWTDPFRWSRIAEVLGSGTKWTVSDMAKLQTDYASLPARALVPMLRDVNLSDGRVEKARETLLAWDMNLDAGSVGAGVYEAWYRALSASLAQVVTPAAARPYLRSVSTGRVVEILSAPSQLLGARPAFTRDSLIAASLKQAVADLTRRFGADTAAWKYGSESYHHALISHPLSAAVSPAVRARLDVGPAPRGGDGNTVGATGGGDNQTSGASFRIVVDVGAWDNAVGTNNPGQSGDPSSRHYRDLFAGWSQDRFFPVAYGRDAVTNATESITILRPAGSSSRNH